MRMVRPSMRPVYYLILSVASFIVAALTFMGVFWTDFSVQVLGGAAWIVIGLGWYSKYHFDKKRA